MERLLSGPGILGTCAPFVADLALILVSLSAIMLTIGWQLARHKHFGIHRWVQTSAVTLNTAVVGLVMLNAFLRRILPGLPSRLLEADYGVTTLHALVGAMGLLLGVFVVLRANGLVPRALQFENYKLFMRTAYALYMLASALGILVYARTYMLGI